MYGILSNWNLKYSLSHYVIANQCAHWCGNPFSKTLRFLRYYRQNGNNQGMRIATSGHSPSSQ